MIFFIVDVRGTEGSVLYLQAAGEMLYDSWMNNARKYRRYDNAVRHSRCCGRTLAHELMSHGKAGRITLVVAAGSVHMS
jgi:hypothetical protein